MATHNVTFTAPERQLGKADVTFAVKRDGGKLGTLKISNGSVVWFPTNSKQGHKIAWKKLDDLFKKEGDKAEKNGRRKTNIHSEQPSPSLTHSA